MLQEFKTRPREEVREKIEDYIALHDLKAHDKLPSERELCKLWGYNRMTLRSAIQSLVMEGILYSKTGSGTYIAPEKISRNLQDLKSFSKTVEEAGRILDTVVLSTRIIESNKQISQKLNLKLGHKVFELIRLRKIDKEPIMIETTYVNYEKYRDFDKHDFSCESLYKIIEDNYGTSIMEGQEKIGITYATEEESELLNIPVGEAVFFLTGVVNDVNQTPVEYFKTIARSDKMRFSSKMETLMDLDKS